MLPLRKPQLPGQPNPAGSPAIATPPGAPKPPMAGGPGMNMLRQGVPNAGAMPGMMGSSGMKANGIVQGGGQQVLRPMQSGMPPAGGTLPPQNMGQPPAAGGGGYTLPPSRPAGGGQGGGPIGPAPPGSRGWAADNSGNRGYTPPPTQPPMNGGGGFNARPQNMNQPPGQGMNAGNQNVLRPQGGMQGGSAGNSAGGALGPGSSSFGRPPSTGGGLNAGPAGFSGGANSAGPSPGAGSPGNGGGGNAGGGLPGYGSAGAGGGGGAGGNLSGGSQSGGQLGAHSNPQTEMGKAMLKRVQGEWAKFQPISQQGNQMAANNLRQFGNNIGGQGLGQMMSGQRPMGGPGGGFGGANAGQGFGAPGAGGGAAGGGGNMVRLPTGREGDAGTPTGAQQPGGVSMNGGPTIAPGLVANFGQPIGMAGAGGPPGTLGEDHAATSTDFPGGPTAGSDPYSSGTNIQATKDAIAKQKAMEAAAPPPSPGGEYGLADALTSGGGVAGAMSRGGYMDSSKAPPGIVLPGTAPAPGGTTNDQSANNAYPGFDYGQLDDTGDWLPGGNSLPPDNRRDQVPVVPSRSPGYTGSYGGGGSGGPQTSPPGMGGLPSGFGTGGGGGGGSNSSGGAGQTGTGGATGSTGGSQSGGYVPGAPGGNWPPDNPPPPIDLGPPVKPPGGYDPTHEQGNNPPGGTLPPVGGGGYKGGGGGGGTTGGGPPQYTYEPPRSVGSEGYSQSQGQSGGTDTSHSEAQGSSNNQSTSGGTQSSTNQSTSGGSSFSDAKQTMGLDQARDFLGGPMAREANAANPFDRQQFMEEGNRENAQIGSQAQAQLEDLMARAKMQGMDVNSPAIQQARQNILRNRGAAELANTSKQDAAFRQKAGAFDQANVAQNIQQRAQDLQKLGYSKDLITALLGQQTSGSQNQAQSTGQSQGQQQSQSTGTQQNTSVTDSNGQRWQWNWADSRWAPVFAG